MHAKIDVVKLDLVVVFESQVAFKQEKNRVDSYLRGIRKIRIECDFCVLGGENVFRNLSRN